MHVQTSETMNSVTVRLFVEEWKGILRRVKSLNITVGSVIDRSTIQTKLEDFEHRSLSLERLELHVYLRDI